MKNPLTSAGIEPATFRFVAQHLNHSATAAPRSTLYDTIFYKPEDDPKGLKHVALLIVV